MTPRRNRRWRSAAIASAAVLAVVATGCSVATGDGDRAAEAVTSVPGPAIGLADAVPASLAFVDQSVAPSTGTIALRPGVTGVHSAPDALYTRVGEVAAGDRVGLTGNRAGVDGEEWAEIIWGNGTAWIPTSALAS